MRQLWYFVIYRWRGKEKLITFHFGRGSFNLFIEGVLIIGGTLGRCGSSSVENIDEVFFHDCKLSFLRLTAEVVAIFRLRLTQNNTK